MKSWVLVAGLLAAAVAPPALAADMGDGTTRYQPWTPSHPYEDDNDIDMDNDDDDGDGDDDDNGNGYDGGYYGSPPEKRFSGTRPPYGKTCTRSEEVRERLTSDGWRDFHAGQPAGGLVTLRARRPNGRLFELTLERCTGRIVDARSLDRLPPFAFKAPHEPYGSRRHDYKDPWFEGPYAYRGPRRPWFRD